jgi:hypothetical protein
MEGSGSVRASTNQTCVVKALKKGWTGEGGLEIGHMSSKLLRKDAREAARLAVCLFGCGKGKQAQRISTFNLGCRQLTG